ncbi:GFA family protein [Cupriavidus alkaliphilus]|uniref:GFA family protein n=1 Tax=Cupriavidus alkaliphilus TaxID=942866 RepID=UPI00339D4EB2
MGWNPQINASASRRADVRWRYFSGLLVEFEVNEKHRRRSRICPRCDTRLWAEPLDKPNISILRPGNLYDQRRFEPVAHVYTRSKQSWFLIPDSVAQFETYPADPEMLISLWRQASRSGAGD